MEITDDLGGGDGNSTMIKVQCVPKGSDKEVLLGVFDLSDFLDEIPEDEGREVTSMAIDDLVDDAPASSSVGISGKQDDNWQNELKVPEVDLKSPEELKDFVLSTRNPNTVRKTNQVVQSFKSWLEKNCYEYRDIEDIAPPELDNFIANYLLSKKKKDGSDHQPDTLTSVHRAILRHLKHAPSYPVDPNDEKNFTMSREVLASKRSNLKKEGYGNRPNKAESFDDEEVEHMWKEGALGSKDPATLQHTVFWYLTIGFGLRGCDESKHMKWGDVELHTTKEGVEFLQFNERSSKTRKGHVAGGHLHAFAPKVFATGTAQCPVYHYKMFTDRRPNKMKNASAPFYLTVRQGATIHDSVGYISAAMGINKMREVVKTVCTQAGITGRHTNHSLRKTSCQKLLNSNVPPTMVAQLSGHKNLASLNNYATASKNQQQCMSDILTGKLKQVPSSSDYKAIADKRTPPSNGAMMLPPVPFPVQLPVPSMNGSDQRLAQNTAGMFAGAYVTAPITLNFNYHIASTSHAQVNSSQILENVGNPSDNV